MFMIYYHTEFHASYTDSLAFAKVNTDCS